MEAHSGATKCSCMIPLCGKFMACQLNLLPQAFKVRGMVLQPGLARCIVLHMMAIMFLFTMSPVQLETLPPPSFCQLIFTSLSFVLHL